MKNVRSFHFLSILFLVFFFAVGFAVTGIINNQLVNQRQTTNTKAAGPIQEPQCTSRGGECQSGKLNQIGKPCSLSSGAPGIVEFNLCPSQGDDIRCCVPNSQPTSPANVAASLTVELQGIGPNANIVDQQRTATIKIYDNTKSYDKATYTASDTLTYNPSSGKFLNPNFNFGSIPQGEYQMVIQIDTYLDEQLMSSSGDKILSLDGITALRIAEVEMQVGDIAPDAHGDNYVNIIDYNALIGCLPGAPLGACLNRKFADLNNDGIVDQKDLDLLLLNFGDRGFAFQTDQFECAPDPACGDGKKTLQLCSLLCTRKSQRS